ncbi:MAG: acyltransferase [Clostridia bacterium]|nr:acyltransferase [Clostridia bacterium]
MKKLQQLNENRNYGLDFLRLLSMFMVVTLHVLGHGGALNTSARLTFTGEFLWLLEIACFCAVNVFAIISGYVGIKAKHKYKSLILLCLQIIFYSLIFSGINIIINLVNKTQINVKDVLNFLFPSVKNYWYFSAYFCLFFFMPLLNTIIEHAPRKTLKTAGVLAFLIFCIWNLFSNYVSGLRDGYSIIWLVVLYLTGGYFAKYQPLKNWSAKKCLFAYLICIIVTALSKFGLEFLPKDFFTIVKSSKILVSYLSPTIVLSAVFLVNLGAKLQLKDSFKHVIGYLSPMAFGVYVIHCHPFISSQIKNSFSWIGTTIFPLSLFYSLLFAFLIFSVCIIIDKLRIILFKLCKINYFSEFLAKQISKLFSVIISPLKCSLKDKNVNLKDQKDETN